MLSFTSTRLLRNQGRVNLSDLSDELKALKTEHRALDTKIKKMAKHVTTDSLDISTLKREKCSLKRKIDMMEKSVAEAARPMQVMGGTEPPSVEEGMTTLHIPESRQELGVAA